MTTTTRRPSPPDTVRRFERRRWRARFSSSRRWLIAAAVAVLAAFTVWVVFFSSWLATRSIEIQGDGVSTQAIRAAADVQPGTPLARVDLTGIANRVKQIPAVEAAHVERQWPHTILIIVTRRTPVGSIQRAGHWWELDRTGVEFGPRTGPLQGVPVVRLDGVPTVATRDEVAAVLGSLPPSLAHLTTSVTASSVDSITLQLSGGSDVRWGTADQSAAKARVLTALLLHHKAQLYDVSIPSQPAIRG